MTGWLAFLAARGAVLSNGVVADFGDPAGERAAAVSGSVVAPLLHLGALRVSGPDAVAFLHGQLTNDVKGMGPDRARYAGYCTPKGRLLANFLAWREGEGVVLALARELVPAIGKRLRMFVLRSKVTIADASDEVVLLGLAGPEAARAVQAATGAGAPAAPMGVARGASGAVAIRVPGGRFVIAVPAEAAQGAWESAASVLRPAGTPVWEWLEIRNGLTLVTAPTQDELVPQMANLELVGGVSFDKGCYPGQEVVARSQYLGKVKRRTYLAHVPGAPPPRPGEAVFASGAPDQPAGIIVNVAPAPGGGCDVLATLHSASAEAGELHVGAPEGPRLTILPLPYALP
ncbi:MAG: folate-binding protein YgfZ [Burkholderiales bacterium]|nr:folate-binding protein YgfZ [Burkholderiales bacterium]